MSNEEGPGPEVSARLGYLLKHAAARIDALSTAALMPLGITPQELGIMVLLASHEPASQQQAAQRLGVDRTTMVARLDALEQRGLVTRRSDPADRRRNVVELTAAGTTMLRRATEAAEGAERELLAALSAQDARRLRDALHRIVTGEPLRFGQGPG